MFKKTLAAVAVLGAFAGSAMAANVTLYGVVDEALQYSYTKAGKADAVNSYGLASGVNAGSRWGVKGVEELGNGYTVGFQLESGFSADDGVSGQGYTSDKDGSKSTRLFGRVASLFVTGPFGTLAAGRDGALDSGLGTVSYIYSYVPLGAGIGYAGAPKDFNFGYGDRADNTLTYVTPDFGGVKVYAQYSFQANGQEEVDVNNNNRYAALGVNYKGGAFSTGLVVDYLMKGEYEAMYTDSKGKVQEHKDGDRTDQWKVSYGASYDFGVAKVMGMVQYTEHLDKIGGVYSFAGNTLNGGDGLKGWNVALGTVAPVAGGDLKAQVNYVNVKDEDNSARKLDGYGLGLEYVYPLSKRTAVYTWGTYNQFKDKAKDEKTKVGQVGLGLTHKF